MEQIQLGIVGAGFMGEMHARGASETHLASIAAVTDVDRDRAQALADRHDAAAFQDLDKMFIDVTLDAVLVTTPEGYHRDAAVAAAQNGCHVFVEKPIARTLEDADAIIDACDKYGVKLMVGYILRFEAAYAKIYQALSAGTLGTLLSAYGRRNVPVQEAARLGGRTTVINYLAVHDIDQILWYNAGHDVRTVYAKAIKDRVYAEHRVPDYNWMMFEFDNDSLGIVETGWGLPETWKNWQKPEEWGGFGHAGMKVVGSEGMTNLDLHPMNLYSVDSKEGWKFPETRHWPLVNGRLGGAAHFEILHFLESVLFDTAPLIDGYEGRRSLEVAIAAERSIATGTEVELPL